MKPNYTVAKSWYRAPHIHHNFRGWTVQLMHKEKVLYNAFYCKTATEAYRIADEWNSL